MEKDHHNTPRLGLHGMYLLHYTLHYSHGEWSRRCDGAGKCFVAAFAVVESELRALLLRFFSNAYAVGKELEVQSPHSYESTEGNFSAHNQNEYHGDSIQSKIIFQAQQNIVKEGALLV